MSVKRLYLDFGSNTKIDEKRNRDRLYKVGLKDQFEKLSSEFSYEDFVTNYIAKSNVEVGISYPNFERKEPSEEENRWYNIAVRMSVDRMPYDIVMMCDLNEYKPGNNPIHRTLRVKGFTLLDKGANACGEILEVCDVFTRSVFADVWYNENFEPTIFLSEEDINLSILSIPFLKRLNEKYVAEPHLKVINRLDKWQKYLNAKNEVILKDSGLGYSIDDGPELLLGYFKNGCTESEKTKAIPRLIIKGKKDVWSSVELPGSRKAPLLRIAHDFLKKDYNRDDELRKNFGMFTSDRSLIMSEKYRESKDDSFVSNFPSSIRLSESKISSKAYEEEIINEAKIDRITKEKDDKIILLRKNTDKDFIKEIDILLEHYSSSELQEKLSEYQTKQYNLARGEALDKQKRLISEEAKIIEQGIDKKRKTIEKEKAELSGITEKMERCLEELDDLNTSLKKASRKLITSSDKEKMNASRVLKEIRDSTEAKKSELKALEKNIDEKTRSIESYEASILVLEEDREKLPKKHSLDDMVQNIISPLIQKYRNELIEKQKKLQEGQLRPKYDQIFADKVQDAQDEAGAAIEKVLTEETRIRLHVFYRLDVDNNADPETILKNTGGIIGGKSMYLYKDFSGDRAILLRQAIALNNLRNGSVMNPFLATALFNSASQKSRRVEGITDFYSKRLNKKQEEAVEKAISSNGLFLIRGPPGTGKTEVIAEITAQLVTDGKKVLIASENHKAVDNAFTRLPELPILRRVRLFGGYSSKKEEKNQYSVRSLTRNFYSDIAKCLEDEVKKASNSQEYAGRLDEIICEFKLRADEVQSLRDESDVEMEKIVEIEKKIERLNKRISEDLDDNTEYEVKISEIRESINDIENIDGDSFDSLTSTVDVEYNGLKLPPETIRALYALRKTEINEEYITLENNQELFDLLVERSLTDNEAKKKSLEVKIIDYQKKHDINVFEFKIVKTFPNGMPDRQTAINLKDEVGDQIFDIIDNLGKEIESLRSVCSDTSRDEQNVRLTEKELQDLRAGEAVNAYETAYISLNTDIREVLSDNNIIGNFKTPEEGIEFIENEKSRIQKTAQSSLSNELQDSYRKMADYLRDESVITKDEEDLNEELLEYANVIGLTCTTRDNIRTEAGEVDLKRANLDVVIIDEVSKISFLEVLHPIMYGKTVILVGDDKQLAPMYPEHASRGDMKRYNPDLVNPELEAEFKRMYEHSFFKELYTSMPEHNKTMLTVQYRMHPDIMDADNIFYDGKLTYGGADGDREHYLEVRGGAQRRIITKDSHLVFIDVEGEEIRGYSGGKSYINYREVEVITKLLGMMESSCTKDRNGKELGGRKFEREDTRLSLGVICGYSDQAKIIRDGLGGIHFQSFNRSDDERFMVETIDNFQGDERDIILLSLVRSRPGKSFMKTFNRINVAISRARCLLIIVGHAQAFSNLRIQLDERNEFVYRKIVELARNNRGMFTDKDVLGE